MRRMANLHTPAPRQKLLRSPQSTPVQRRQELRRRVAVEIGEAEGFGSDVPAGAEPEEVGQGGEGVAGFGG